MKKLLTIFIITISISHSIAQPQSIDSSAQFQKAKGSLNHPIKNFTKLSTYSLRQYCTDCDMLPKENIYYLNKSDTVKAIYEGKIISVLDMDTYYAIMTKFGKYFIIYIGLEKPTLKKGDYIFQNQFLGMVCKNSFNDDNEYLLRIRILNDKADELDPAIWIKNNPPISEHLALSVPVP